MNDSFTMPKGFPTIDGYVIGLEWLPPRKRKIYEDDIRVWCKANPDRKLWPEFVFGWAEKKKYLEKMGK